ncbi:flavin reductase family protein [Streptomyces alboflavus]|uniref:flavin reductase family protein n=1 Tax=Streptomyces alboflavus TaxID=67267 RepID=UPI0036A53EE9
MSEHVMDSVIPQMANPVEFRSLMAALPAGVAVVTATDTDGKPWGMTCSSLASVALDPPTLLICLRGASPTLDAALSSKAFAVNLLHDEARAAADLFASGDPDRFDRVPWIEGASGPHLIESAHAVADCQVAGTVQVGDHTVVFGEVRRIESRQEGPPRPLLYGLRQYWSLDPEDPVDPERGKPGSAQRR